MRSSLGHHVCEVCGLYCRTIGAYLDCLDRHEKQLARARIYVQQPEATVDELRDTIETLILDRIAQGEPWDRPVRRRGRSSQERAVMDSPSGGPSK